MIHHPFTGQPCLFVGNVWTKRVTRLHQRPERADPSGSPTNCPRTPELQVRWQWRKGDVALWDNFGTTHYGVAGDTGTQTPSAVSGIGVVTPVRPTLDRERAVREPMASHA